MSEKKVSRQREWQLRKKAEGKCIICGVTARANSRCEYHARKFVGYISKWKKLHPEEVAVLHRKYYAKNKARLTEYKREYREKNREKVNLQARLRRARKKALMAENLS